MDDRAGLIGDGGEVAGAVVGVLDGGAFGIFRRRWVIGLDEALAGVVVELRGVARAVGLGGAVAGVVVGVGEVARGAGDGCEAAVVVVVVVGGDGVGGSVGVGLAGLAIGLVVEVVGGGRSCRR